LSLKNIKKFINSFLKFAGNVGDLEVFSTLNKLLLPNSSFIVTMVDLKNISKFILAFFTSLPIAKSQMGPLKVFSWPL
jgi:hypothetical protein